MDNTSAKMERVLGKITKAEYGTDKDYPFLFGLQLSFSLANGGSVSSGIEYMVNVSKDCKWENDAEKLKAFHREAIGVAHLLKDAKVNLVSQLVGKPVEVIIVGRRFDTFRILTEVL